MLRQAGEVTLLGWFCAAQSGFGCVGGRAGGGTAGRRGGKKVNKLPCRAEIWTVRRGSAGDVSKIWEALRGGIGAEENLLESENLLLERVVRDAR
jgi:hypothetical protein